MTIRSFSFGVGLTLVIVVFGAISPKDTTIRSGEGLHSECTPYRLEHRRFAKRLSAEAEPQQRAALRKERWEQVKLAVGHCELVTMYGFHRSLKYWHRGWMSSRQWMVEKPDDLTADLKLKDGTVLVLGDSIANIESEDGAMIHILGDLKGSVKVTGQCEIVVGGNLLKEAEISGNGIVCVFVGGDVSGRIRNQGSGEIWVNGDMTGKIGTGVPSTNLHVVGDFRGFLKSEGEPALLELDIRGFMATQDLNAISQLGFTEFIAAVGCSDEPPGLYPVKGDRRSRWVILRHGDQTSKK